MIRVFDAVFAVVLIVWAVMRFYLHFDYGIMDGVVAFGLWFRFAIYPYHYERRGERAK